MFLVMLCLFWESSGIFLNIGRFQLLICQRTGKYISVGVRRVCEQALVVTHTFDMVPISMARRDKLTRLRRGSFFAWPWCTLVLKLLGSLQRSISIRGPQDQAKTHRVYHQTNVRVHCSHIHAGSGYESSSGCFHWFGRRAWMRSMSNLWSMIISSNIVNGLYTKWW